MVIIATRLHFKRRLYVKLKNPIEHDTMIRQREKVEIQIVNKPHRLRWGLVYYVQMASIYHQRKVFDSIRLFADFHGFEDRDFNNLRVDYYKMLDLLRGGSNAESLKWGFVFYTQLATNMHGISINEAISNFTEAYSKNALTESDYQNLESLHKACIKVAI